MQPLHTFHNIDVKIVLENLDAKISGLSNIEVLSRQRKFGKNILKENTNSNLWIIFFSQFLSPLIFILIFASIITIYLNEIIETVVIWSAILINVFFSAYQEYKAENTIRQLKKLIENKAIVKRDNKVLEIKTEDLTIGDIVILQNGSRVPADIRIIESVNLKTDETILTGESLPIEKENIVVTDQLITERKNYCFSGTLITNGNGFGIVTHIGENTEIGKIAKLVSNSKRILSPVQTAIKNISWYIFIFTLFIVIFILFLGIYRGENFLEMLILASAVAVGSVPEALPIALTVILSVGVLNISKKGGLIRKLSSAETLGSTTLILTDKTGTLTEGKLKLENILEFSDLGTYLDHNIVAENLNLNALNIRQKEMLLLAKNNFPSFSKNPFEAILSEIIQNNKIETLGENYQNTDIAKVISTFNSTDKYSLSLKKDKYLILGAPDILINNSNLESEAKNNFLTQIHLLSMSGKRLIALAEKHKTITEENFKLTDLNLLGVFIFSDILRKDIHKSIEEIINSGVKVKIITGDLPGTAKFIGEKVGIQTTESEILTGSQLANLTDNDLLQILGKIKIFARVTPEDKLRIGKLYQKLGEVVAMTGDGVNDAPSLKTMDIGISLSSGSEVAKSASDMVLLKDDFKTIVDTILIGRNIRSNIQKIFVYLMSSSLDEVLVIVGSLLAGLALPLTALQIIWVNILTGTLPVLAFAYNRDNLLQKLNGKIFDFRVKFLTLGIGTFSSLLLFILYYLLVQSIEDIKQAQSIFFLCFASYTLIIAYSFIDLNKNIWQYNPFSNWRLNLGVSIGLLFIFATVYTPFAQNIFQLQSVSPNYLYILLIWLILNILIIEISKMFYKTLNKV